MGKVIKQAAPGAPNLIPADRSRVISAARVAEPVRAPQGYVLPAGQFDTVLHRAEQSIRSGRYEEALQSLLNLEVTRFHHMRPHELLADVYLKLGHVELAKEQYTICSNILAAEIPDSMLKSFNELVQEAGDVQTAEKEYRSLMEGEIGTGNLFEGTKIAFHLAAHRMNEHNYREAERILSAFRERCLASAVFEE